MRRVRHAPFVVVVQHRGPLRVEDHVSHLAPRPVGDDPRRHAARPLRVVAVAEVVGAPRGHLDARSLRVPRAVDRDVVRVAAARPADVYVVAVGNEAQRKALATVEQFREKYPMLSIVQHTGGGSFKSQMKRADKSGARIALIWGEDEVAAQTVTVKSLRNESAAQVTVALSDCENTVCAVLAP